MTDHLKEQCIDTLEKLASLSEIADLNPFKIRAYKVGAAALREFGDDFLSAFNSGHLKNIPGIGKGILAILTQVINNEHPNELDELSSAIPITLLELLKIDGLGPKRARLLWQELDIKNLGELEYALKENRLRALKGFSEKLCQNIGTSITELRKNTHLFRLDQLLQAYLALKEATHLDIHLTGAASRAEECAKNLELSLLWTESLASFGVALENKTHDVKVDLATPSITLNFAQIPCLINICSTPETYGAHLLFHRCEPSFWQKLTHHAAQKFLDLRADGVSKKGHLLNVPTETELFSALEIYPIPAERRDEHSVITSLGKAQQELVKLADLKGAFHNHTIASDGKNTLQQMRQKAIDLGLTYLSISDHSQSAFYANGLKNDALLHQLTEIQNLNQDNLSPLCHLFSGTESDILADGSLDFADELLTKLDVVIASVHSRLKQNYEQMTTRMVNAAKNPLTCIIGHPTGRLILDRPKSSFDMRALVEAASLAQTALELNANPHRLDLDVQDLRLAKEASVLIAINADAHSTQALHDLDYGIMIARRAGLRPQDVLNCMDLKDVKIWLQKKREINYIYD